LNYRRLGKAGVKVSEIGFGNWLTHGEGGVSDDVARACIRRAFDLGVNFFDTADKYRRGLAEEVFGRELKVFPRQDLVLGTKVGLRMSDNPNDRGLSRKHIFEAVHNSLRRLQTDYLDLYQCHDFHADVELYEIVQAMDDLVRQGKILYWGLSKWPAAQIESVCQVAREMNACAPVSHQSEYNVATRDVETDGVQGACLQEGIGMLVFSPLKQGILSGKYSAGTIPGDSRGAKEKLIKKELERGGLELLDRVDRLRPIAQRSNCTMPQLAIAWLLGRNAVSSVITGASNAGQIEENVAAADVELTADDVRQLDELFPTDARDPGDRASVRPSASRA
jgi:aryl-alcohol dehydrogenase-like predicted oxidoreductase